VPAGTPVHGVPAGTTSAVALNPRRTLRPQAGEPNAKVVVGVSVMPIDR
jgi:hypothetical protein